MRNELRVAMAAMVLALAACNSPAESEWRDVLSRVEVAENRWQEARPVRYVLTEQRLCECPPEQSGPVRIEATGTSETVSSMVYAGDGQAVAAANTQYFHTVAGLFEIVREAAAARVFGLEIEFDPALGYPTRIFIDRSDQWLDDEVVYLVTSFQSL